jgi:hypothetical protein
MNANTYTLIILVGCIGLLMTSFPNGIGLSSGEVQKSAILDSSGTIQQSPQAYTYIISVSGSNYQMKNGNTGAVIYQNSNAATTINYALNALTNAKSILFQPATYILSTPLTCSNKNDITLYFDAGAVLYVGNGMNAPALTLRSCTNWLIQNPTIDGNSANQNPGSKSSPNTCYGIDIRADCQNVQVDAATISNCAIFGFSIQESGVVNCGITNSVISDCGWNGIQLGYLGSETSCYANNNEVSYCSDVGITTFGVNSLIQNNNVHDITGSTGYANSHWGIAVEGGNTATVTGNTITNCGVDIATSATLPTATSNTISYNTLYAGSVCITYLATANNTFDHNTLIQSSGVGVRVESGTTGTIITNNDFTSCSGTKLSNSGSATTISGNTGYP